MDASSLARPHLARRSLYPLTMGLIALLATAPGCPDQIVGVGLSTPCTSDDQCLPGQWCDVDRELCAGTPIVETPDSLTEGVDGTADSGTDIEPKVTCVDTTDCWAYEDGDLCNGFLVCQAGACVPDPSTVVVCPAGPECEPNVCNPDSGYCEATVIPGCLDTPCTNASQCPSGGPCEVAACVQGKCGFAPLDCNDGDECTDDFCDNGCQHIPNNNDVCVEPPECQFAYQCPTPDVGVCAYADCIDGECVTITTPSDEVCNDGQDNDCDGLVDCADNDCVDALACGTCSTTPVSLTCDAWTSVSGLWSGAGIGKYSCTDQEMPGLEMAFSFELPYSADVEVTVNAQPSDAWFLQLVGSCTGTSCVNALPLKEVQGIPVAVQANTPVYFVLDHQEPVPVFEAEIYVACPKQEICQDFFDNDGDGLTDCADPDCKGVAPCQDVETQCFDGIDNDGDGLTDCADPNCASSCVNPEVCGDGIDNDGDGLVDCADSECKDEPECNGQLCDAPILDVQCETFATFPAGVLAQANASNYPCLEGSYPGAEALFWLATPKDAVVTVEALGTNDFLPVAILESCDVDSCIAGSDGTAPLTMEAGSGPPKLVVVETQGADLVNLNVYCDTPSEVCNDGFDNDGDGQVDCQDSDCDTSPSCQGGECVSQLALSCDMGGDLVFQGNANVTSSYPCAEGLNGNEAVLEFVASKDGPVTWNVFTDDPSAVAQVLAGSCGADGECLAVAPTFTGAPITFNAQVGQSYYLVVDAPTGAPTIFYTETLCGSPQEENCFDGFDNDGDGLADCADNDCNGVGACQSSETLCSDGFDNDGDGLIDCEAPWCADNWPECGTSQQCNVVGSIECNQGLYEPVAFPSSVLDNYDCIPGNFPGTEVVYQFTAGSTGTINWYAYAEPFDTTYSFLLEANCDGSNCVAASSFWYEDGLYAEVEEGKTYYLVVDAQVATEVFVFDSYLECYGPENCSDGQDNDGDGAIDCADSECAGQGACQTSETNCTDGFDNDGNGDTDCEEVWCKANSPLCGFFETCGDGIDNDGDGYEDCDDAECAAAETCSTKSCDYEGWPLGCNQPPLQEPYFGNDSIDAYNCSQEQMPGIETVFDLGSGLDGPVSFSTNTDFQGGARALLMTDSCGSKSCQQLAFQTFDGQLEMTFFAEPDTHYWIVVDSITPWEIYTWETTLTCL